MNIYNLSAAGKRRLLEEFTKTDYLVFLRKVFATVQPGTQFHQNWHHAAIAHVLDRVMRGELRRVLVTVPPRSLKSITISVAFPAFLLARDSSKKILCVSYSNELATKLSIDFRAVMKSAWYRRAFPGTVISSEKDTETELLTTQRGGRYSTSVGGTLTGRGGDVIIIDDPMKPEEAMSEVSRARVKAWYETTLMSRLNDKVESAIIVVMQRLHMDDLAGVLLDKGGWYHLDLPAIADTEQVISLYPSGEYRRAVGDVLDAKREPKAILDELKASMGEMTFSAQYQQRPVPLEGYLIKRAWLQYYDVPPDPQPNDMFVWSWDTALKASQLANYSVGTLWHVRGNTCYLREVIRDRYDFPSLKRAVLAARNRWPQSALLVEDKGSGTSLIQQLRTENVEVIAVQPVDDKITRLYATQPMFEGGSVVFPKQAPWLDVLLTELMAFPNYRTDDQVDSISQALTWIRARIHNRPSHEIGLIVVDTEEDFGYEDYE